VWYTCSTSRLFPCTFPQAAKGQLPPKGLANLGRDSAIREILRWAQILISVVYLRRSSAKLHYRVIRSTCRAELHQHSGALFGTLRQPHRENLMMKRAGATIAFVLILTASTQPADAFLFGILSRFFQPFPIVGIQTYATPTQIGTAYVNKFPFTTPPARKACQWII